MKFIFLGLVTLAFIAWEVQDFAASLAATEVATRARLRTTQERDDARVMRAFEETRRSMQANVVIETEADPRQETRDTWLTVTASSKREALDARAALVTTMQAAFAREGPGELFDISNAPYADPVKNEGYRNVQNIVRGIAVAILLAGVVMLARQWKHSGLPKLALVGIAASAGGWCWWAWAMMPRGSGWHCCFSGHRLGCSGWYFISPVVSGRRWGGRRDARASRAPR
ncbi:hypothetical protein ACFQ5Q_14570 [Luteolibacter ambystomatis]|uniref:hypothetical protein n=1 Tax=Luteolibacter ambystomatis TaxID=2824561 RepID=UPI001CF7751E|nr:hypothetical protein [Luteolibacter ambystomatis]